MTPDDHLDELLGAYALDAVDDLDRRRVEAYLAEHPRSPCRGVADAPGGIDARSQPAIPRPKGCGTASPTPWTGARRGSTFRFPAASRRPAPRRRFAAVLAAAALLVAAAAGVVTALVLDDGDEPEATQSIEQAYEAARDDPGGRLVSLASEDGTLSAEAVVQPDGVGFLSAGTLPELPVTETYQLWGVYSDGDVISLGVVGNRPAIEPFAAEGELDALVITKEAAGGVSVVDERRAPRR